MKVFIAFLLIFLVSNQANAKTTSPSDAFISFFNQLELNEIPIATLTTYNDTLKIKDLVLEIINGLEYSRTWIQIADSVSKVGKIFDLAASDIVKLANDTILTEQVDSILNKVNEISKDPKLYFSKVLDNIKSNPVLISWSLYDVYSLLKVESYDEFGKRFANVLLLVFEGKPIPTPPRNLKDLILSQKHDNFNQYHFLNIKNDPNLTIDFKKCYNITIAYLKEMITNITEMNIIKFLFTFTCSILDIIHCLISS